jgi:hypothetical protein
MSPLGQALAEGLRIRRVQARPGGAAAGPVHRLPPRPPRRGAHHRGCAGLGEVAHRCHAALVSAAADDGARVRRPPAHPRPTRRGPATRAAVASARATPGNPVPVLPGRHRRARPRRQHAGPPARGGDLPDPDRAAGRQRDARRRGNPARPRRPRRRPRRAADRARQQVRQVPPGPAAPNHRCRAARLSAGTRPAAPSAGQPRAAALHRRHPAGRQQPLAQLPPAGLPSRPHRPLGILPAENPRPSPQLRGAHHARLVRPRRRRARPAAQAIDLSRPHRSQHTYWYLQAAPELLALAAHRLDAHQAGRR